MSTNTLPRSTSRVDQFADQAADTARDAVDAVSKAGDQAMDAVSGTLNHARRAIPEALSRKAAQAEDIARRGIDRARELSGTVRAEVSRAGDRTVGYIKDEPVKSILIAVAAGALVALVAAALTRDRRY